MSGSTPAHRGRRASAFPESIAQRPSDGEILYWGALAHARAGAVRTAHSILDRADAAISPESTRRVDVLSLRGRLWKDAFERASESEPARVLGERARDEYLRAFAIAGEPYPGINAATLSMLLGDREEAARLAADVSAQLEKRQVPLDAWDLATLGEADLLMSRFDAAQDRYLTAYGLAAASSGVVATMRRQLKLLARAVPRAIEMLAVLPAPHVVAFAGHMVDLPVAPRRAFPRRSSLWLPRLCGASLRGFTSRSFTRQPHAAPTCCSSKRRSRRAPK